MSRSRLLRSWLDDVIEEFPQAKATAQQWMAGLRKNPKVAGDEIRDRGLEEFLTGQEGAIPKGRVQQHLAERPMPVGDVIYQGAGDHPGYSTRGMDEMYDNVYGNPFWDSRYGKEGHYGDTKGYQFHTREGVLSDPELGKTRVLDEVQRDFPVTKDFNPLANANGDRWANPGDMTEGSHNYAQELGRQFDFDSSRAELRLDSSPQEIEDARQVVNDFRMGFEQYGDSPPDEVFDLEWFNDGISKYLKTPRNMPGGGRLEWQGAARALENAVHDEADALVWPSSEVQYRRYFQRSPEHYQSVLDADAAASDNLLGALVDDISAPAHGQVVEAKAALGSNKMYENVYDKKLPRDKRWKQLGLEVEPVELGEQGKYWAVKLTPEIRKRLAEQGIPFYAMGGMAVLGQQDGALEDGT